MRDGSPESLPLLTVHAVTTFLSKGAELINNQSQSELFNFVANLKNGIWSLYHGRLIAHNTDVGFLLMANG